MNVNHKLQLLDQMDDAAFALMMDEYAESEGERLRAEFEADMRSGLTPHKPDGLDDKCRTIIKKEYAKQRRREYASNARRFTTKAAAAVLIALGITAATIMSVEAFRVPFWKLISEVCPDGIRIVFSGDNTDATTPTGDNTYINDPIFYAVPEGYHNVEFKVENGRMFSVYQNDTDNFIILDMSFSKEIESETSIPIEDEYNQLVRANGRDVWYNRVDDLLQISWYEPNLETNFTIASDGISETDLFYLGDLVMAFYKNAQIDHPAQVPDAFMEILPDHYEALYSEIYSGYLAVRYTSDDGNWISFDMSEMVGTHIYDAENADITECTILDYEATYIENEIMTVLWYDEERQLVFNCGTIGFSKEEHMQLCEYLAGYYKNVTLPAISTVILP